MTDQDLIGRSQRRQLQRHPWLLIMTLLGVIFGVAGVVAMDIALDSCRRGFQLSQRSLQGDATHWVVADLGDLDENLLPWLRLKQKLEKCAPVVEGRLGPIKILGVDPLAQSGLQADWLPQSEGTGLLGAPGAAAMTASEAHRLNLELGGPIQPGLRLTTLLTGLAPALEEALKGTAICDISTAQVALAQRGKLSRIELVLTPEEAKQLATDLPSGALLITAETRSQGMEQMTRAFFLNLRALSGLSLLVGLFLIYNVVHFLALQRRTWMARLRLLGVTDREIRSQILAESAWLATVGSLLGTLVGIALSQVLLPLLTRTINDLYYSLEVRQIQVSLLPLLRGCLLGWLCTLVAAYLPARELLRAPATDALRRSPLEHKAGSWSTTVAWTSLLLLGGSLVGLLLSEKLGVNLAAMFGLILGSAGLTPALLLAFQRRLWRQFPARSSSSLWVKFAMGGVERNFSRLGVALLAMTVALSAVLSITLMIHSFRLSLIDWLGRTLRADVYVALADRRATRNGQPLPESVLVGLQSSPNISRIVRHRMRSILAPLEGAAPASIDIVSEDLLAEDSQRFRFLGVAPQLPLAPGSLLVSEPFAQRHRLRSGDSIPLPSADGSTIHWNVAGVFQDYASEAGYILMDASQYRLHFADTKVSNLAVYLKDPSPNQIEALRQSIQEGPDGTLLEVRSQRNLREISQTIFEQTFQVTGVLQILAVLVASAGVAGAVASTQLERGREKALWKSLGLTHREQFGLVWLETSWCALWAGLAAWPCGMLQAYAMVTFINRRAFGWTLDFHLSPGAMLATPVLALLASTLAVVIAPWLAGRSQMSVAQGLRED